LLLRKLSKLILGQRYWLQLNTPAFNELYHNHNNSNYEKNMD
jgi:hypothetical protein